MQSSLFLTLKRHAYERSLSRCCYIVNTDLSRKINLHKKKISSNYRAYYRGNPEDEGERSGNELVKIQLRLYDKGV
jgi:hypothetical protein